VLDQLPVLPVDEMVAEQPAIAGALLEQAGTTIGMNDLWIAATALASGLAVVTSNHAEFSRVPELPVIRYGQS